MQTCGEKSREAQVSHIKQGYATGNHPGRNISPAPPTCGCTWGDIVKAPGGGGVISGTRCSPPHYGRAGAKRATLTPSLHPPTHPQRVSPPNFDRVSRFLAPPVSCSPPARHFPHGLSRFDSLLAGEKVREKPLTPYVEAGEKWQQPAHRVLNSQWDVYERQLCLSCITGIYGCRWKRYQRSHDDTTKWELLWSLILLLTFCLLLVWCYFWWEAHNDYNEFNWFLYNRSGEWSDGTVPILATTAAGFTYIAFLMILALCHVSLGQQLNLHWLHKVGVTVALLTTAAGVISINQTWGQEWDIIPISLQATGPFLHIGALAAVTALSWIVAGQVARAEKTRFQVVVMLLYLSLLLGLYVTPLYITSPCIMERASLKPRPDVIGLRGASMLAPENTLWSFQRALQMNVTGLEADVAISVDGVPFLMHDRTLRRTTDVEKVFPDRQMDEAALFNWTDLQQLNAGQWFLKEDPYWTVHALSSHEKTLIANQSVCSLEQLLNLSSYHNSTVVFRLRRPPLEHPFYHSWINDTLHAVQQSRVPQNLQPGFRATEKELATTAGNVHLVVHAALHRCDAQFGRLFRLVLHECDQRRNHNDHW
ncbi:unnamed protein product, partial [Pleuronectes platessa]